jgi:hypothetical protein
MIVTLSELLIGMVLLPFAWIVLDWFLGALGRVRERSRCRRAYRTCHLCGLNYGEEPAVKVSTCPRCSGQNERKGHRKLG